MDRQNDHVEDISKLLREILDRYNNSSKLIDNPRFCEGNSENMVFSRLERAAYDQRDNNDVATLSRYGIWAADVCQLVKKALGALNSDDKDLVKEYLTLVHNAVAAFVDIQAVFDSIDNNKMGFYKIDDIISTGNND